MSVERAAVFAGLLTVALLGLGMAAGSYQSLAESQADVGSNVAGFALGVFAAIFCVALAVGLL